MHCTTMEYNVAENTKFRSKEYLKRFKDPSCDPIGVHAQFLQAYHDFYQQYSQQVNLSNATVLEFGGGPTLYSLISASAHVKGIVFAEYAAGNRAEVMKWRNRENGHHDWAPYIKHVVTVLEGDTSPAAVEDRHRMMREKLKDVITCDIKTDDLFEHSTSQMFDVIQTNLCLDSVCDSVQEYSEKVKKLKEMLKPGGVILSLTALDSTWYTCAGSGKRYHNLKISEKEVEGCYKNAGLALQESITIKAIKIHSVSGASAFQFIAAQLQS